MGWDQHLMYVCSILYEYYIVCQMYINKDMWLYKTYSKEHFDFTTPNLLLYVIASNIKVLCCSGQTYFIQDFQE